MNWRTKRNFSLVGLLLLTASAIAATWMTAIPTVVACNGLLVYSTNPEDAGWGMDVTCTNNLDEADCWTQSYGDETSTLSASMITMGGDTRFSHGVINCLAY